MLPVVYAFHESIKKINAKALKYAVIYVFGTN